MSKRSEISMSASRSRFRQLGIAVALAAICAMPVTASAQGQGASVVKRLDAQTKSKVTTVASRSKHAAPAPASPTKPTLVGTFGDWGTYVSQGAKSKVCYALAQPSSRSPSSLKRETAYVFISNRPGEGVRNEVSIIMGVPLKDGANGAKAEIGSASYDLVAKGQNAFVKNAAEEGQFVGALKKRASRLTIRIPSARGGPVTDTYSLSGIAQALDRVAKECP